MYTYLLSFNTVYPRKEYNSRRVLNFDREIESVADIEFIESNLKGKLDCSDIRLNGFSMLKKNYDEIVYSLDNDWE